MSVPQFIPPQPPPNFTRIDPVPPGTYLVGHDQFTPASFPLTTVLHRDLTPADDFLLGILSVILIAVVSDLAHTVLLRTTSNRVSPAGLFSAFLVNEATHLRNVLVHLRRSFHARRPGPKRTHPSVSATAAAAAASATRGPPVSRLPVPTTSPVLISAIVLVVLVAIFVADVVIVVVTQPRATRSSALAYNLRAEQPVQTRENVARYIRRMAGERTCVTPFVRDGPGGQQQLRRYLLTSCVRIEESVAPAARNASNADPTDRLSITSFFHAGGSDHNVSFASGWISIAVRVQAVLDNRSGGPRWLLFDSLDDAAHSHALHLHALFMHRAKVYLCTKDFGQAWCTSGVAKRASEPVSTATLTQDVRLWRGKSDEHMLNATGVVSVFDERLSHGFKACNSAVRTLIASAVVREVRGPAAYIRVSNDARERGVPHLLAEEERLAGVALLAALTAAMLALMAALRCWLKPTTLGELAFVEMERALHKKDARAAAPEHDERIRLDELERRAEIAAAAAEAKAAAAAFRAAVAEPEESYGDKVSTDPMFGLGAGDLPLGGPPQVREYDRAAPRRGRLPTHVPAQSPGPGPTWRVWPLRDMHWPQKAGKR